MTVAALIEIVRRKIREDFYSGRDREFFRDKRALTQAIARYGFECNQRGWEFSTDDICKALSAMLNKMRSKKGDIQYLPAYLQSAIDQHIREHADELNEAGKEGRNIINKAMGRIKPAPIRQATPVETLGLLYADMQKRQRRKKKLNEIPKAKQRELL